MLLIYIILFLLIISFIVSYIIFKLSLCRYTKKGFILDNNMNKTISKPIDEKDIKWFNDNNVEITIKSKDDLRLKSYLIKNKAKKFVILVHGFTSAHSDMIGRAKKFYDLGYSVLLLDLRGHGKSDGKYITMGIKDCEDLRLWVDYLIKKEKTSQIGLYGISMGAATVMMSLSNMPSVVKFAIEDCGYTSVWDVLKYQLFGLFHLPSFPFLYISELYAKLFIKIDFKSKTSLKSLANSKVPILMIHGTKDTFVPYYMLEQNYEACKSAKQKYEVDGANHAQAEKIDPEKYWDTIKEFLKTNN